ncbi:ABC transporter substrate-binding protein [Nakamurella flava]|uniref:ABC transporter substrate-binding protein n=1 Tax=Nakamurella flava TaxID=2576308 RepID=A0A4U6QAF3_9ACTN|nr:ABC transporter substrate-binding protein [Nakamurella flava]TKV56910.1 ABC transporter substrate-binding protein [Nakamurella flava]
MIHSPPRTTRRRLATTGVGVVTGTLLLTGCFAGTGGSTASSPTASVEATSGGSSDARVRVAFMQPPRSNLSQFSDDAFKLSRLSIAETLVVLDENGDAQPALATSWEQVNDTTWRFTLREGVKFHDGNDFDAASVVTALTAATKASPKPRILDGVDLTVTSDAPGTVTVTTGKKDPLVPQRLSSPQLSILSPDAYTGGPVDPIGNGTGPFELVAVDGTSTATLNRFDGYWGEKAKAAGIDASFVPDGTARAAALRTGTADVVEAVPVAQAAVVDPALIHEVPMPRTNTLYLNTEKGVFTDPAVRAAARRAINPSVIVDQVYEGRADVAKGLLGPALPWSADRPERTPTAAATDIATTRPKITLGTFTDRAELPEVAVQLEQQLEAAGFEVEQVIREYSYIEKDALAGNFDAFILSRATVLDSGDPAAYMYSDFSCEGSFNISQLCDPNVDQALQTAAAIPAGGERRAAILQAEKLILDTDAAVPMLHERVIQGEQANVTGAARDPRERTLITADTQVG